MKVAIFFATLMTAGPVSAQSLVPNGGFEDGFTGWNNLTQNGASATFSLETGQPSEGTNALMAQVLTLDPSVRYQTMDGIGGNLTWYSQRVLTSPHRATLEQLIFDDLGLDIIRLKNWYFPADYPGNQITLAIPEQPGYDFTPGNPPPVPKAPS